MQAARLQERLSRQAALVGWKPAWTNPWILHLTIRCQLFMCQVSNNKQIETKKNVNKHDDNLLHANWRLLNNTNLSWMVQELWRKLSEIEHITVSIHVKSSTVQWNLVKNQRKICLKFPIGMVTRWCAGGNVPKHWSNICEVSDFIGPWL